MGDQRLVRVQFQGEGLSQEPCQLPFDLLRFGLRADEPEQMIICIPAVKEPPVTRVFRID